MRSRFAMFVDAGYLLAAGAWATVGPFKRGEVVTRVGELIAWLQQEGTAEAGDRELLRVYWYDAAPQREPTPEQQEVARQPDTKLRLGSLNRFGEQKGVDALLLADMMDLALSKGVDLAFLVSGDEDMLEAVKRIQAAGIRLHLWGVDTPKNTVSLELRREADRTRMLTSGELGTFFIGPEPEVNGSVATGPAMPTLRPAWLDVPLVGLARDESGVTVNGARPVTYADIDPEQAAEVGRQFAGRWIGLASDSDLAEMREARRPSVPYQIDARLLTSSSHHLGLSPGDQIGYDARVALRNGFWDEFERWESTGSSD